MVRFIEVRNLSVNLFIDEFYIKIFFGFLSVCFVLEKLLFVIVKKILLKFGYM